MARPISLKQAEPVPPFKGDETGIEVVPKPHWAPPKGLDYLDRKNRVPITHAVEMLNLYLDRGVMKSRKGTSGMGAASADDIMGVVNFVVASGIGFLLRFTITHLQQWNGAAWVNMGTAVFTGGLSDYFCYTAFNDTLLFSNGKDGLWEFSPLTGALNKIVDGPNALHLSTFGGRVLATNANFPGRLDWSAKNNSHDWTGVGSGNEELLSTPGGKVDGLMGVWPVTDDFALMVRVTSVWQVSQTGDPDAPFRFGRLHSNLGSRSRHSIDVIPGGIVMFGTDDVWLITDSSVTPIGQLVKDRFIQESTDLTKARGIYRPETKEYWLTTCVTDVVYRYSFPDQGWSRHKYAFDIRWMEQSIFHFGGITWDEMVGTWDTHPESWDSLLGVARAAQFLFATDEDPAGNSYVIAEDAAQTSDVQIQSDKAQQGIEIQTPVMEAATPLDKTEIIECQLEYEQGLAGQILLFEYATDGGTVWNAYSSKTPAQTTGYPKISRAMKTLERDAMQLRIRSVSLGRLTIVSFSPFLVQGAKKAP